MRCAVLVLSLAVTACPAASPPPAPARLEGPSSAPTRWIDPRPAEEAALLEAPARVLADPGSVAAVGAPLQARIVRVRVRAGQRVSAGDPVVDVLMPEVLHAAGDLAAEQIKVEAFGRRRAQLEALKSEGLVRLAELAEVEAQLATARADAQAARAMLRAAGVGDRQAEQLVQGDGVLALRAPLAGVVTTVDAVPGEMREPTGRPLLQIVGAGEGRVEARLPLTPAAGARFRFVSGGLELPLTLLTTSPRLEPTDGTRLAWFEGAPDAGGLPSGATGRVRVLGDSRWRVVPIGALIEGPPPRVRAEDGRLVEVEVVARSGAEAVVTGLEAVKRIAADAQVRP